MKIVREELRELEECDDVFSFEDIYCPDMIKKVYDNYDEYMANGDFHKNILDEIMKSTTANEYVNLHKILNNLEFDQAKIDWQPNFLLMNSAAFHTIDLYLNSPEKVTTNHKMALYALDMYTDMDGDEDYPHVEFVDQLKEMAEMFADGHAAQFVDSAFEMIKDGYIERYKEFTAMKESKRKK